MKKYFLIIVFIHSVFSIIAKNKCFNATPNYVEINTQNLIYPQTQITIEFWAKPNNLSQWSAPLSYISDDMHNESGFAFSYIEGKLVFMLKTTEMRGDEWNYNPGVKNEVNQWSHISGTYDGESIKIYLNGELIESKTTSGLINWDYKPAKFHIGAFKDFNEKFLYDGLIDEVRVWNVARTSNEIYEFKNKKLTGDEEGLIAYYDFDQDNNSLIRDLSQSNNHGKLGIPSHEQTLVPSGAMIVPDITALNILSPSSFQIEWETSESVYTYDYYLIELSKDRSFNQLIANEKSLNQKLTIENITGGSNIYARIKAFSKDIGFTAYSEVKVIANYSTALSILVTSISSQSNNTKHKLVDYNVLMADYIVFPNDTKDLQFNFKLNNIAPENITSGKVKIKGPSREYNAEFSQNSDVSLFDLKAGKYDIEVIWGSIEGNKPLSVNLIMDIKERFYELLYVQIIFILLFLFSIFIVVKNFRIIPIRKLQAIQELLPSKENNLDWIDPEQLEKKALFIKDYVTQEKLYLDPKFNLKLLAEKIDFPHYQISRILKDYFKSNFNDFINELRVKEFVLMLNENKVKHIKNSAIAYDCGFYSESTFFRAFKKFMGKTPQQYQKELSENEHHPQN